MSLIASAETIVNTYTNNAQNAPAVTKLANGGWVVTWASNGQDGDLRGIFQQHFAADGTPAGGEIQVNTETADQQDDPSVTALPDGGWVVTWSSLNQDGSNSGIYQQRYDQDGNVVGAEIQVNTETIANQIWSSVAALADGGWVVSWASMGADSDGYGIFQQRYDATGGAIGSETQVNTETALDQSHPTITALADGGWVVAWASDGQDGDGAGVYLKRFHADGTPAGGETLVNTLTDGDQVLPTIAGLADGGFVATWVSDGQDGDQFGIFQQRYDASGAPVGGEQPVNTETFDSQSLPVVTGLAGGGWVVSWTSQIQDGSGIGVYLQCYNADGTANGGEYRVNSETAGNQTSPTIAALADGGFLVAWQSPTPGQGVDIYQKVFHPVVNVAPGGTDAEITIDEGSHYNLDAADFGYVDTQYDFLQSVIISNIAGDGLLTFGGDIVTAGQQIDAKDLDLLRWTPSKNAAGLGVGSITFQVVDNGGTTDGGIDTDSTPNTLLFHVNQINDAPSGNSTSIVTNLEEHHVFTADDFGFSDLADGNHFLAVILNTVPQVGTLTLAGAPVLAGQEIPVSQISNLVWTPPADGAGNAAFLFQVRDDGGAANGGVDTDPSPNSFEITYGPHQAPEGIDVTLNVPEDKLVRFSADQFAFADADGDHFTGIVISSLPGSGKLRLDGQAVDVGDFIARADLAGLAWKPARNAFGDNLGNFTFQMVDDGSLAQGGQNTDQTPNTVFIHVSDVLDRFIGTAARNTLVGTAGKDLLDGRAGNDKLTGGASGDIFVFRARDGRDVVTDFDASPTGTDIIDIRKIAAIADFTDLTQNHMHEANGNVIIDGYGTSRITLKGVAMAELTADDFLF